MKAASLTFALCQYMSLAVLELPVELAKKTDHKTLAVWVIDCVKRILPYFEEKYPEDHRPRQALETLQAWINPGAFKMIVIRRASLTSHAAAREDRATKESDADAAVANAREWRYQHLRELGEARSR